MLASLPTERVQPPPTASYTRLLRAFFFLGGLGMPFFSGLFFYLHPQFTPQMTGPYVVMLLCLGAWGVSFWPGLSRPALAWLGHTFIFGYLLYSIFIFAAAGYPDFYLITTLVVGQVLGLLLRSRRQVWVYFIVANLALSLPLLLGEVAISPLSRVFMAAIFLVSTLVIALVQVSRIGDMHNIVWLAEQDKANRSVIHSLIESSADLIWAVDQDFRIIFTNKAYARILHHLYGIEVPIHYDFRHILHHIPNTETWIDRFQAAFAGEKGFYEIITKVIDGTPRWLELSINPIRNGHAIVGASVFARDYTDQRRMADDLHRSEERLANAIAGANDGVWEWDLVQQRLFLSDRLKQMMGYAPDELSDDPAQFMRLVHPQDQEWTTQLLYNHIKSGQESIYGEFRMQHRDGHTVWMLARGQATRADSGRALRLSGAIADITQRKENEALLRGVLASSTHAIMALRAVRDDGGQVVDFTWSLLNAQAESVLGHSSSHLQGKRVCRLFPGIQTDPLFAQLVSVIETGGSLETEFLNQHPALSGTWYLLSATKLDDGLTLILRDIAARKSAEAKLKMLSLVAERTTNGVVITDAQGRVEWINAGFSRLTGYTLAEIKGKVPGRLLQGPDTDPETVARMRAKLAAGEPFTEELINYHRDGRPYWIRMAITPIRDDAGTIQQFIAIEDDITPQKATEQALRQAKDEAEAAAVAKAEFLANMSHEIRTPMNAVIGMTGLLLDTDLTDDQHEFVETIRISGENLLTVINDILDFSKIDAGKLELEAQAFELRSALEDVLDLLSTKAQAKGIELMYDAMECVPDYIISDPTRLNQILVNLTNNALKFTAEGEVMIHVSCDPDSLGQEEPVLQFAVHDTGIGIPADKLDQLFESFSQVDASTTRKYGGTGLGLAISRRLVALLGGRIWVESTLGQGSTFFFTLPIRLGDTQELTQVQDSAREGLQGLRVLLVDDNETNLKILHHQCAKWGMVPISTAEPAQVQDLLAREGPVQLAILDMQMPHMDGVQLARSLNQHPDTAQLPLILLSSIGRLAESEGGDYFQAQLSKPWRRNQLYQQLLKVLAPERYRARQQSQPPPQDTLHHLAGLRILMAEDNTINQKVTQRVLEKLGLKADIASNGLEAVKALEDRPYDLILMDVQMPEMDGLAATQEIRRRPGMVQPVIIAMTANALKGDRERCLAAGMDDYVSKPLKIPDLQAAIARWFRAPVHHPA